MTTFAAAIEAWKTRTDPPDALVHGVTIKVAQLRQFLGHDQINLVMDEDLQKWRAHLLRAYTPDVTDLDPDTVADIHLQSISLLLPYAVERDKVMTEAEALHLLYRVFNQLPDLGHDGRFHRNLYDYCIAELENQKSERDQERLRQERETKE
jgi:hypothetical protein